MTPALAIAILEAAKQTRERMSWRKILSHRSKFKSHVLQIPIAFPKRFAMGNSILSFLVS